MNAEQMFEELGYEKKEESEGVLLYISDFENSILFENKRVTITDLYCYGRITININCLLENAIHKQCKELGWLEEEKPEIKRETNLDHYKDDIAELFIDKLALVDGKPERCKCVTICDICDLYEKCNEHKAQEELRKWLKQPYKNPLYKLSQFEFDLIQTYRDGNTDCKLSARRILRELKDKGYFKCVDYDTKIQDILENCEVSER